MHGLASQPLRFLLIELLAGGVYLLCLAALAPEWALLLAASLATALAWLAHDGRWWCVIHAAFLPAVLWFLALDAPPWIFLLAAGLLWLLSGSALRERVPLYLSSRAALDQLALLIPRNSRFVDLGAGSGTVLAGLALRRPDLQLHGIERSFLPWLCGRLRLGCSVQWLRGDFWGQSLADFDCVYVFLSGQAMDRLWEKASNEMASGSFLISNTFAVPGVEPDQVFDCDDWKGGKLMVWRM